jgi:hypothetical protein
MSRGPGLIYTIGALAAIAALAIAAVVLKPGYDALARRPETTEDHPGDERLRLAGLVQVSLLIVAVAAMATARYFG